MIIKALTLWQPWASLMALEEKKIETRSWSTKYQGLWDWEVSLELKKHLKN